ncbi:Rec102p NDAI_0J01670 [Naumovozyma dairenensis CBS 421]|uniref:Uncharacterized protein n=1 Tax=Naumovozyma dairenensis (strain ATCC 10597 / BCRC 20456 / CBS 421 / NBRC 0211 / NRRL Y-12639) TaxID=1071378 RepID=G0WGY1_NAUDC|nr:hypothetical protein NDAI_0J01670 [Naumovozyma dairenensis CBS 421]CCD27059.1 hypothetical protein NDAI_0J01670 [Naumovozyma dairenensis CBS 421]
MLGPIKLNTYCLKSHLASNTALISQWNTRIDIDNNGEGDLLGDNVLILPPKCPTKLNILIKIKRNDIVLTKNDSLLEEILSTFKKGRNFWENLLYDIECSINSDSYIQIQLTCKLWTSNKLLTLLENPISLRPHITAQPSLVFIRRVIIQAHFIHLDEEILDLSDIYFHFNEYFASLFISTLEFQFPLVFSNLARNRARWNESSLAPISYALTESSRLLPYMVQLVNNDTTATTAYQLLTRGRNIDPIDFQLLKI